MGSVCWPAGKKFAICLTHDVDRVYKRWWHSLYYFVKTRDVHHIKTLLGVRGNPYWNFDRITELEEKYGVRSTFFFLEEKKKFEMTNPKTFPLSFGYYSFDDPRIIQAIRMLDSGGWEIGLHGSYESYRNEDLLRIEKSRLEKVLGKKVIGVRQHFLNLDVPGTWQIQKKVGFNYDASFGFRERVGWRDGKDLPFRPFEEDNFLVIPLTIMDVALERSSRGLKEAAEKVEAILKYAERRGSLVTVLWHQRVFNESEFPGWSKLYEKIIVEGKRRNAWFATCREVYEVFET
ncbi:polysaccharide deacetylase family protein [Geoglobus ahangari]|uniref:polysaccharide deacetylase family protein n=1 Tax=Geoglobus ahangari TaxID=113653 RepID=UPI00064EED7A|nr:polysaccharide deacetylase family protein [Geoglobus ahangari]